MLNRLSILAEDVAAQEAYAALSSETEAAISAIPTKMKGATAEKKRLRGELGKLDDAADANQKVSLAEVAKVHEGTIVAATTDYHDVITTEEFDAAVTAVKDVVSLHLKASDAAKAVAHVILQGRLKIRDKSGNADTRGASHQAKAYAGDVYRTVAAGFELAEDEENLAVIKRLQESTSYHMSDEVATLARELDEDVDRFKDLFPGVAAAHPDLTPRAALVASSYAPDKSKRELAAERQKAKALAAGTSDAAADAGEGDSEGETTEGTPEQDPFEAVSAAMTKGSKLIAKAWAAGSKLDTDHKAVLKADLTTLAAQLLAEANKL
jgi:hypothetical protein